MIKIINRSDLKINNKIIKEAVNNFFEFLGKKGDLTIIFVREEEIKKLNSEYRNNNKITDILSFQNDFDDENIIKKEDKNYWGELIICSKQIKKQASKFFNDFDTELIYMISHGLIHLQGYEDETEKGRLAMEKISVDFMKKYYD